MALQTTQQNAMLQATNEADAIPTEVYYILPSSAYEKEKPYELRYDGGGRIPQTNMDKTTYPIKVHDFRPLQSSSSWSTFGFTTAPLTLKEVLSSNDFDDPSKVKNVFYPAVEEALKERFSDAAEIIVLEHGVSLYNCVSEQGRSCSNFSAD
jgi:hypothetical protein